MNKKVRIALWFIVGPEYGFFGEGSQQWYYTLAIAINLMLVWWIKPEIALIFTILPIIHFVTVFVFGYNDLLLDFKNLSKTLSIIYIGIHLLLLITAIIVDVVWAILTSAIMVGSILLAPDCVGDNMLVSNAKHLQLLFNTIILAVFIIIERIIKSRVCNKLHTRLFSSFYS